MIRERVNMWNAAKSQRTAKQEPYSLPHLIGQFSQRIPINCLTHETGQQIAGWLAFESTGWVISDQSGRVELGSAKSATFIEKLDESHGHWAVCSWNGSGWKLDWCESVGAVSPYREPNTSFHAQKLRFQVLRSVREFFWQRHFTEVDTPVVVPCPGMETHLDPFWVSDKGLRTSPELHMKRLLAAGWDRIFQLAPSFRDEPVSTTHHPEFIMLEWYRTFADLSALIEDIHALLVHLAPLAQSLDYFSKPLELLSIPDVFKSKTGIDLTSKSSFEAMQDFLRENHLTFEEKDDWDCLFFLIFLNFIEPDLGAECPTVLIDYPASQSALAKLNPFPIGAYKRCFRFELYCKGIELANAFYELCDPVEQFKRFETCNLERKALGKRPYPIDDSFFRALETGMPPSAGIALGLERLIMLLAAHPEQTSFNLQSITPHNDYQRTQP